MQLEAVSKKLVELNPGFEGKLTWRPQRSVFGTLFLAKPNVDPQSLAAQSVGVLMAARRHSGASYLERSAVRPLDKLMPFRLWFYLAKVGGFILFAIIFATFFAPSNSLLGHTRFVAMCILVPLCLVGAFMGILMAFGRLRMLCPFCSKSGRVGGSKCDGMWMECESCGFVHGSGFWGLKIVREEIDDDPV